MCWSEVWEAPSRETKQGGGGLLWQDPRQRLVRLVLGQWQDREGGSTREQAGGPGGLGDFLRAAIAAMVGPPQTSLCRRAGPGSWRCWG